jgi:hypothetical protein
MFTDRRLREAYGNAKVERFDENSKYIFFSDCHRGDDSASDEFTRNQSVMLHALNHYYRNAIPMWRSGTATTCGNIPTLKISGWHKRYLFGHQTVFRCGQTRYAIRET